MNDRSIDTISLTMSILENNDILDDQESQLSLQDTITITKSARERHGDLSLDPNGDNSSKTIDIEKLKQLQNLYRLNLIQQQMEQNNAECNGLLDPITGNLAEPNLFSSLEVPFPKLSKKNNSSTVKPTSAATATGGGAAAAVSETTATTNATMNVSSTVSVLNTQYIAQ